MKLNLAILAVLAAAASPVFAEGDAAKGEATFKQCQTCHTVADDSGAVLAGKGSKTGPNLYGVFGRQAGIYDGFKYGDSIVAAGEAGLVWDETHFVTYVQDPVGFLKDILDDRKAKSKMSFKVRNAEAAADLYAFLIQFSPNAPTTAEGAVTAPVSN